MIKQDKKSTHILFSDDDTDDALLFTQAADLLTSPILLSFAEDGEQLMRYLAKEMLPDMIFLDLKMPGRDGFDVLSWLRRDKKLEIPVAVLTSSPEEIDRQRARELGADCYLLKPPTRAMVLSCCRQFELNCQTN